MEPSAAARGEPLLTDDGWTIRFENLAFQTVIVADAPTMDYGGEVFRWNARARRDMFTTGLAIGPCTVTTVLKLGYALDEGFDDDSVYVDMGLTARDLARFRSPAEGRSAQDDPYGHGLPSVLITLRAEKGDRVVSLDLTLASLGLFGAQTQPAEVLVRANDVSYAPMSVEPERLFVDRLDGDRLRFDPFALADADHDGVLSSAELVAARVPVSEALVQGDQPPVPGRATMTLLDRLRSRSALLFVAR